MARVIDPPDMPLAEIVRTMRITMADHPAMATIRSLIARMCRAFPWRCGPGTGRRRPVRR